MELDLERTEERAESAELYVEIKIKDFKKAFS